MRYIKFEGDNLYFSPMDPLDLQTYTKWINEETLARGIGRFDKNISEVAEKKYLEDACLNTERAQFSVIEKGSNNLIGTYGLNNVFQIHGYAEVGGFIGDINTRGKGYGSEALRMLCDYSFNVLNLRTLVGRIFDFNIASIKSVEKVGFIKVGEVKERYFFKGEYHNEYIYQISREEFYNRFKTFLKDL